MKRLLTGGTVAHKVNLPAFLLFVLVLGAAAYRVASDVAIRGTLDHLTQAALTEARLNYQFRTGLEDALADGTRLAAEPAPTHEADLVATLESAATALGALENMDAASADAVVTHDRADLNLRKAQVALLHKIQHQAEELISATNAGDAVAMRAQAIGLAALDPQIDLLGREINTAQETDIQTVADEVNARSQSTTIWLGAIFSGVFVLVLIIQLVIRRGVVRPIRELSVAAQAVAAGRRDRAVVVTNHDEIGELQRAFNQMVADLRDQQAALEVRNRGLEAALAERARVEADLRQSEERFAKAFRASPDPVSISRLIDGRILDVNDRWLEVTGFARDEVIGQAVTQLPIWADTGDRERLLAHLRLTGSVRDFELVFYARSGEAHYAVQAAEVIELDGEACILVVTHDVTAARRAADALRERERQFRAVFDNALDGMGILDDSGRYLDANAAACTIYGLPHADLLNHRLGDFLTSKAAASLSDTWAAFLAAGQMHGEFQEQRQPGAARIFEYAGVANFLPGRHLVVLRDISERKRAEEALRTSEEHYRRLVDISPDAIMLTDLKGEIVIANRRAADLYGVESPEALRAQNAVRFMAPDYLIWATKLSETVAAGATVRDAEYTLLRQDGTPVPAEMSAALMTDGQGHPTGYLTVIRDITERKKVARLKDDFISTISHELRTPLTSIRGALGLVASGIAGALSPRAQEMIGIAYNNSERLVRLINDILDIEKIESGKMVFHLKPVDLPALVEQALADNAGYAEQYNVHYVLAEHPRGIQVFADPDRLLQVLTNLLSNAAKFSPAQSTIRVALAQEGHHVRVSVADTGPGIPDEFRAHIFEKFAQADSSSTRQKGGTGLGLSISRAIIERLGGQLAFESVLGQGTTFYFELPAWQDQPVEATAEYVRRLTRPGLARVLICEDDRDVATLLSLMLGQAGFACDIATSAAQARQLLAAQPYSAMTLDLALPDGDGIAFMRELRAAPATATLPIVIISARAALSAEELNDGAIAVVDWLEKPIETPRLISAIATAVVAA